MAEALALAGFMGSGKSSVGQIVAEKSGRRFVDLDLEAERFLGCPIDKCFKEMGEKAFRDAESAALRRLFDSQPEGGLVLALGGGTLQDPANRLLIKEQCSVILLDVDEREAWARVAGSGRPLARDEEAFRNLCRVRKATYEEVADWIIPTEGRSAEEVAESVARAGEQLRALPSAWGRELTRTLRVSEIIGGVGSMQALGAKADEARSCGKRISVFTDTNVMGAWGDIVLGLVADGDAQAVCTIEAGETSKSAANLERCWEWLAGRGGRRDDIVVAFGGGVVGDLGGLVAATYLRGVGLWQVPTSLLAQVDSSVGGKTAINLSVAKNMVGAFYQPDLVIIDPDTLKTLPQSEFVGAMGEVVKHALLSSVADLEWLERDVTRIVERDTHTLSDLVKRNVWFKAAAVQQDEREVGLRAMLNLGHTTAHALESVLGYGLMSHGQAVALGLLVALAVSEQTLGLDETVRRRTENLLGGLGLETKIDLPPIAALMEAAGHDKKVKAGNSGFVGLRDLGHPVWGVDVTPSVLAGSMEVIAQ